MDWNNSILQAFTLKPVNHPKIWSYVLISLFLAVLISFSLGESTITPDQRMQLKDNIVKTSKSPFKLLVTFSSLVIEDFWFIFLPLIFLNKINFFHRKTRIIIVSIIFALVHLINFFNFFYLIPLFFANILHIKTSEEHGFVAGAYFHIVYNAVIYFLIVLFFAL